MVGSKHPHLHWSVAGWTSQGTATADSYQQAPLDHGHSVWCFLYADRMDPQVGQSPDGPSFSLCSIFCPCSSFGQEISGLETLRWVDGPILWPGTMLIYRCSLQVLVPHSLLFPLMQSSLRISPVFLRFI